MGKKIKENLLFQKSRGWMGKENLRKFEILKKSWVYGKRKFQKI